MPTYTYECPGCGRKADLYHGVNDDTPRNCMCGTRMKRRIGTGIQVKVRDYVAEDFINNRSPDWRPWDR